MDIRKTGIYSIFGKKLGNNLISFLTGGHCKDFGEICNSIKSCLGISPQGDPNKFLNEQGNFVSGGAGGTYTVSNGLSESPANNFKLGGTLTENVTLDNPDKFIFKVGNNLQLNELNREGYFGHFSSDNLTYFGYNDNSSFACVNGLKCTSTSPAYLTPPVFLGGGLNDINVFGVFTGTSYTQFTVTVDQVNAPGIYMSINSGSFSVDDTITTPTGSATIIGAFPQNSVYTLSNVTGTFSASQTVTGPSGTGTVFGPGYFIADTFGYSDGNTTVSYFPMVSQATGGILGSVIVGFNATTGHNVIDAWQFSGYPAVSTTTFGRMTTWEGQNFQINIGDVDGLMPDTPRINVDLFSKALTLDFTASIIFGDPNSKQAGTFGVLDNTHRQFGIYSNTIGNGNPGLQVNFQDGQYWLGENGYGSNNRLELNGGNAMFYGFGAQQSLWLYANNNSRNITIGDVYDDLGKTKINVDDVNQINTSQANYGFRELNNSLNGDIRRISTRLVIPAEDVRRLRSNPVVLPFGSLPTGYYYRVKSFDAWQDIKTIPYDNAATLMISPESKIGSAYQAINSVFSNPTSIQTADIIGSSAAVEGEPLCVWADQDALVGDSDITVMVTVEVVKFK